MSRKAHPENDRAAGNLMDRRRLCSLACGCAALASEVVLPASQVPLTEATPSSESWLTSEDRIAVALMEFRMGFHCSQSVMAAYAEDFGLDPEIVRRLVAGLAGGSTVGGECGAVGGAYLVLGLRHGRPVPAFGDVEKEAELFRRIERFVEEFRARHGAITCRELLGIDVFSKKGRQTGLEKGLFASRCPAFIQSSIEILEELG